MEGNLVQNRILLEVELANAREIYRNLSVPVLVEKVIQRKEGVLSEAGAVVVETGCCTGRSPGDKFIVHAPGSETERIWWGKINRPFEAEKFDRLLGRVLAYLQGREVFTQDVYCGAHPGYRLPVRIVSELAWQSLFARNLFLNVPPEDLPGFTPQFTVLAAPGFQAVPERDGTASNVFILLDFSRRLVLIGGTHYAGEIKKSVFSLMNYLLPDRDVLPMHCSANIGIEGDTALFFGLSGTGKTTLSSDPGRRLIGDDEHGWGEDGVFNFEGGCYAKTIRLKAELEPMIWDATHRFGAVLENVVMDPVTREIDFEDGRITENTRGAYPLRFIPNHVPEGRGGHPDHIFFLVADAFGVMPPLACLNPQQAMYHFLSGYTSKLAGTEKGLGLEPQPTFSTCFGAPFLPLHPGVYAEMLGRRISHDGAEVWLVNTGWTGGRYGLGERIRLPHTRALIQAVLDGALRGCPMRIDRVFGFQVPLACPAVPDELLEPRKTWRDPLEYDQEAGKLAGRFVENFKAFEEGIDKSVRDAGPIK